MEALTETERGLLSTLLAKAQGKTVAPQVWPHSTAKETDQKNSDEPVVNVATQAEPHIALKVPQRSVVPFAGPQPDMPSAPEVSVPPPVLAPAATPNPVVHGVAR